MVDSATEPVPPEKPPCHNPALPAAPKRSVLLLFGIPLLCYVFAVLWIEQVVAFQVIDMACEQQHASDCDSDDVTQLASGWLANIKLAYSGTALITTSSWGALSDIYGRRPIMLIQLLGLLFLSSSALVVSATGASVEWLVAAHAVSGLAGGPIALVGLVFASCADTMGSDLKASHFTTLEAMTFLAAVCASASAGPVVSAFGRVVPYSSACGIAVALVVYGTTIKPEPRSCRRGSCVGIEDFEDLTLWQIWKHCNPLSALIIALKSPTQLVLALTLFLYAAVNSSFHTVVLLYAKARFHWDNELVSYFLASRMASKAIVLVLAGRVLKASAADSGANKKQALFSLFVAAFVSGCYAMAPSTAWLFATAALEGFGGFVVPMIRLMISKTVMGAADQGKLMSALVTVDNTASFLAPAGYSMVWKHVVGDLSGHTRGMLLFGSMAVILLLAFVLLACSTVQSVGHAHQLSDELIEPGAEHVLPSPKCVFNDIENAQLNDSLDTHRSNDATFTPCKK